MLLTNNQNKTFMHLQIRRALTASVLPMVCLTAFAQKTVTGTVKDAKGEPLIGVTVFVDGKPGSITDIDGNFSIPNASPSSKVKVSYIGYKDQTVTLGNSQKINIVLQEDNAQLDEVVVVGYGTMKKSDLTGSVSSVDTEKLNAKGAPSVLGNLQGANPGVNITQSTGRTNGDFNIEIRGKSSINGSTTPLYVVDGVMCSDIQFLNPQDIERIDILKDASSTAIYGSRATAGVVMVTTKSGSNINKDKMSKPTISYDGYYGVTKITRTPDFMNGNEFMNFRFAKFLMFTGDRAATNGFYMPGGTSTGTIAQALLLRDSGDANSGYLLKDMVANGATYDWPDLVTQTGQSQNHYLAISGAKEGINYHFGVGYDGNKGVYKGDKQDKINFKGSVDARVNKVISAGFSMNLAYIDNEYANDDAVKVAYRMTPFSIPYDEEGNIIHLPGNKAALGTNEHQFSDNISPLDLMRNTYKQRETWRLLGNVYVKLDLMKGLDFKTTFSPSYTSYRQGNVVGYENPNVPGKTYDDKDLSTSTTTLNQNRSISWTWDNIINYNTRIAKDHSLGVMGLISAQYGNSEAYTWVANGCLAKTDWFNMQSGTFNADDSKTSFGENSMISYALRLNYGYKDKYLLTATSRWDGSSKFADGHRWGCFPSVALAWRASEESFLKSVDWLSNLKLRLSYGVTGNNDGIGNYATQQVLTGPIYYPFGSTHFSGYYPSSVVDKLLSWEESREFNFGVDFGFLNNRINGTIDLYSKKSKDLLYNVQLPLVSGGGSMVTNVGSVKNTGIEISLNTVNIQTKDWNWTTSFTFSHNKNKVVDINGTGNDLPSDGLFIGEPVNNVYEYKWDGVVSDRNMIVPNTEIAKEKNFTPGETVKEADYYYACYGWSEGSAKIVDRNGDGTIDQNDKFVYRADPVWVGSLTSNLSYKNWDFSFSIYTKQNFKVRSAFMSENVSYSRAKQGLAVDYYIPAGTLLSADGVNADGTYVNPVFQEYTHYGSYPMVAVINGIDGSKSYWDTAKEVVDGSFVKVKNITLGYTFPKKWLTPWGCSYLRLYATVTNPFVFTKYKGFDPEWAGAALKNDGPSTVTYQIGASIKF